MELKRKIFCTACLVMAAPPLTTWPCLTRVEDPLSAIHLKILIIQYILSAAFSMFQTYQMQRVRLLWLMNCTIYTEQAFLWKIIVFNTCSPFRSPSEWTSACQLIPYRKANLDFNASTGTLNRQYWFLPSYEASKQTHREQLQCDCTTVTDNYSKTSTNGLYYETALNVSPLHEKRSVKGLFYFYINSGIHWMISFTFALYFLASNLVTST